MYKTKNCSKMLKKIKVDWESSFYITILTWKTNLINLVDQYYNQRKYCLP